MFYFFRFFACLATNYQLNPFLREVENINSPLKMIMITLVTQKYEKYQFTPSRKIMNINSAFTQKYEKYQWAVGPGLLRKLTNVKNVFTPAP